MSNVEKIRAKLGSIGTDALLVTSGVNLQYVTGLGSMEGAALITKEGAYFFTDGRYIEVAERDIEKGYEVSIIDRMRRYPEAIGEVMRKVGAQSLAFEDQYMTVASFENWKEKLGFEMKPAGNIIGELRASKSEEEIATMIKAQRIAEKALDDMLGIIKPGIAEVEIAAEIGYRMRKYGAAGESFNTIAVSGPNSSLPHGVPGERKVQDGDFVTMDFGCKYHGYCSDMTRTVAVGHVTDEMKKVYETVLAAQLAGIAVSKAGVPGEVIDSAARKVITDAGYGEYFGHSYGHSLGLEIHEAPNAAQGVKTPMPEGAVVSAEPGIYLPGKFGVRIEDVVVMRKDGAEVITKAPKQLIIL